MCCRLLLIPCFVISGLAGAGVVHDDENKSLDYLTTIKPLLESKCFSCHSALKQEGGLRLDAHSLILEGGDSGPALSAGDADGSLIIERVTDDEELRMPPPEEGAPLKGAEIALLRRWIAAGAEAPVEDIPLAPSQHWAFQRIEAPKIPVELRDLNPIDALLSAKRRQNDFVTQRSAERSILIRRLYLDLTGLPPTLEQLRDNRSVDLIVDDLLESPQYGERWGRHWMDVWRYSDWYGLGAQLRNSQKHMWRWRDWIVSSLNQDKGYDRMIQEMLAGDELEPGNPSVVAGTGFLARNYYLFNRTTWLDTTIEHTGKAFLGLTLNCAKCHDHKYDPISQVDYYSFRALFEPHQVRLDPVPGQTDLEKDGLPRAFDDHLDAVTWLHQKGDPKNPDKNLAIKPRVPELFTSFQPQIKPVPLPVSAYSPVTRKYVQDDYLATAQKEIDAAKQALAAAQERMSQLSTVPSESTVGQPVGSFEFEDDFGESNPAAWEIVGDWKYGNGKLYRDSSTRAAEYIRLSKNLPADFEVVCRYTTTGGTTYKSVTFRFDESDNRDHANMVYTSAHAPGPKVQVAITQGGESTYPAEGRRALPIRVGQEYKLKFAVRDTLVNVWLNDEFVLAYQLPTRLPGRRFSLAGFDATVSFDHISIRSLPANYEMSAAGNSPAQSTMDAAAIVEVAQARLKSAVSSFEAVQSVIEADVAKYTDAGPATLKRTSVQAAKQQALALKAEAAYERLSAGKDSKKLSAAETKLKRADQKLAASKDGVYSGLRPSRKALEGPADKESDYPASFSPVSSGRRLALAQWITSRDNPLTARVVVNHVWLRHFGTPLVESVFDFGLRAEKPLHADVLDFLAADFMKSGWSFRRLHRLIVSSQTYQLDSSTRDADSRTLASDATNKYYWRMNARRMEAQVVRDSVLSLAGVLDLTLGGPSVDVGDSSNRRSLYFKHSRDQRDKFLSMFDDADLLQCYRRSESVVPQQALALANSKLSMSHASMIAARLSDEAHAGSRRDFAAKAFTVITGREATADELNACVKFCVELGELKPPNTGASAVDGELAIRTRLVHSLLNLNDFVTIR